MKNYFIPYSSGNLDAFEENLISKLPVHASALGMNADELAQSIQIINDHRASFTGMNSKKAESKSATELNNLNRDKALDEIRRLARAIKSSKNYTTAIGEDLGIIGADQSVKITSELKPDLKANISGQEVVIKFRKEGTDGIKIYGRRGSETEFTFLAVDTASPYNDTREKLERDKPEQREYYAYYFESDNDIGQASDVLKVVVP
ncbi:MAG: hypothetical protein JSS91_05860 [Bacteroidetes bacterium]|nr:hypothetical protein [Bacteroidota bacterium]